MIAADCEDKYHQIEREIAGMDDADQKRYEWKQSVEYVQAIEGFLIELEDRLVDFEDVEFKGIRKSASEIMEFFYEKYTGTPLLDRMGAVMDYFIDEVETLRGRSLNDEEQEISLQKIHEYVRNQRHLSNIQLVHGRLRISGTSGHAARAPRTGIRRCLPDSLSKIQPDGSRPAQEHPPSRH